jgi:hypothetical protein
MLTGEIRSQIDQIWNAFWSGGISNPLEVIEQITYLLFLKRLDEQEIAEELKANREKKPMGKRFFPEGKDSKKRPYQDFRWNRFKNLEAREMYTVIRVHRSWAGRYRRSAVWITKPAPSSARTTERCPLHGPRAGGRSQADASVNASASPRGHILETPPGRGP